MKVRIINARENYWYENKLNWVYEVECNSFTSTDGQESHYLINDKDRYIESRDFDILSEERPIIDYKGIQTEVFTIEEKKVIAVEKDIYKLSFFNKMLSEFKMADEMKRFAILEILEELGYPKTDMVKLYKRMADES